MGLYSEKCKTRLDGKTAIVTGCNTGIGKETVHDLFKRGAYVVMACRNVSKAEEAAKEISDSCKNLNNVGKLAVVELDLSRLQSVRECSKKILEKQQRIDLLINNAGIMCTPYGKTEDGYELQFATNHLGHFLFTMLLLPKIIASAPARIINVSSTLHTRGRIDFDDINWEKDYSPMGAYNRSKLCNILFAKELALRLKEANIEDVTVYSLHPGVIATEISRDFGTYSKGLSFFWEKCAKWFMKTPTEGAQTTLYCALDEAAGKETGLYYSGCTATKPHRNAEKMEDAKKLWDVSVEAVKLEDYNPFK